MAEMIPDRLPSGASAGEKRVFEALQRLPDNCIVYYEPVVGNRYPDFVVIMPEMGLLIIEVKGWYPAHIESGDLNQVKITNRGRTETQRHPIRQARDYMFELMDAAKAFSGAAALLQSDGNHAGQLIFPLGHLVVLNNIKREQLDSLGLTQLFPASKVMTRDEFDQLATSATEALVAALKNFFDPWWGFVPLSEVQISALRAIIHPEIVISKAPAARDDCRETLKTLDLRQERLERKIGDGHRIVYGVAGSGKTVILMARARLLAIDESKQILVLCYNRPLAEHIQGIFAKQNNIICHTFHMWGSRHGVCFDKQEDEDRYGRRLLDRLERGDGDANRFDAVLIDEAQDFAKTWFQCVKLALKEPDDGDLLIVGDGSQAVFRRRPFSWKDAGISAQGRTIHKDFDLHVNYRNTREIIEIASIFAGGAREGDPEQSFSGMKPDASMAVRSGPYPSVLVCATRAAECDSAIEQIRIWLGAGIKPDEIAILYRALPQDSPSVFTQFVRKLENLAPVYWRRERLALRRKR
jgi:AAA domain-containing protein/nuclease-like protein